MEHCTNCKKPLTVTEANDNQYIRVFHGMEYRYCRDCWQAWGDDIFGATRFQTLDNLKSREDMYDEL